MGMTANQRRKLMVDIAHLYYRDKLTQKQIANKIGISHASVSRLLQEALDEGIVEVVIHYPKLRDPEIEAKLISIFNLRDVRVMDSDRLDFADLHDGLGMLAAEAVDEIVKDGMSIGISRGRGVEAVVKHLTPRPNLKLDIIQLQGAMEDQKNAKHDLASIFYEKYDASFHFLHAPMILPNEETRQLLIKKPLINNVLELARGVEMALVGVGTLDLEYANHLLSGELDQPQILALQKEGFVGDICGLHFDADGNVPDRSINRRIISIDEKTLQEIPLVIGIGGGSAKVASIQAALRGNFLDILITDKVVASQLIDWHSETQYSQKDEEI